MKVASFCLCLLFSVGISVLSAQVNSERQDTTAKMIRIELIDGSIIYGTFVGKTSESIQVFSTSLSELNILFDQIEKVEYLNEIFNSDKNGFPIDYHNSTRYYLSPSGYGLKKGQKYFENVWIFWNSFAYGVSDNITLSASTEIASILFAQNTPLIFLNGKFSIPFKEDSGAFGINLTYITIPSDDFTSFTFLSGSLTLGDRNSNITISAGGGFRLEEGIRDEVLPFTLSYMGRLSKKLSFVTENWLITQNDFGDFTGIVSAGVRIHFKYPGSALNIALFRPVEDGFDIIALPFVSGTVGL